MPWKRVSATIVGSVTTTPPTGASATQVQGTAADSVAAIGNPVQIGGVDGSGNIQAVFTDTAGRVGVAGSVAAGSPASGAPVLSGGIDGTNARFLLVDTSGRLIAVGPAGAGAAVVGNPIPIGVIDGPNIQYLRIASTFKTVTATATGDTAVWTPTTGKKFRLLRFRIDLTANAAQSVAGLIEVIFRDATTAMPVGWSVFVPGAAGTTFTADATTGWCVLDNGILSATANNVLNINLSAALTAGEIRVQVAGTEE